MVLMETAGVQPVISSIDSADSSKPVSNSQRVSTRPIKRPARNMHNIVPRPRGPMTTPAVSTG
ncbi:hypothetical protein D3C75_1197330 [compost metagenome]